MSASPGHFFLPGPVEVSPAVLEGLTRPMIPHRGAAFHALFDRVQAGLGPLFGTTLPIFTATSPGTGMVEMAYANLPAGRILALVNGRFSERMAQLAECSGRAVERLVVRPGEVHLAQEVDIALSHGQFTALTVVHCETSTGALNDVQAIAAVARRNGVLVVVDAVSSVGGVRMEVDEWDIDLTLSVSQKAIGLPPGLGFAVASPRLLASIESLPSPGMVSDFRVFARMAAKSETPATPALALWNALDVQLERIEREGVSARFARHQAMRNRVSEWSASADGLSDVATGSGSPTVSVIRAKSDERLNQLLKRVGEAGFVVGGSDLPELGPVFRIGHMGDKSVNELNALLKVLE